MGTIRDTVSDLARERGEFPQFSPEVDLAPLATATETAIGVAVAEVAFDAGGIGYDNDDSGLTADNAQGAIDEIVERVEALEGAPAPASKVTFDPAGTGLAATTVQAAIAEVNAAIVNATEELEDRVAALEGAPSNLGGALAASWSPSIDINSINGGSLTLDA